MRSPQYKIRLDPALKTALEARAEAEGRTVAGLIKRALALYLAEHHRDAPIP